MNSREWIPNIDLGEDYDRRYRGASVHYDGLRNLAEHFGRKMPVHRHAQSCQLHFIEGGRVSFHIEDQLYEVQGPCLFLTPAAVPHSFETEPTATGHVLTLHQSFLWQLAKRAGEPELSRALSQRLCLAAASISYDQTSSWEQVWALIHRIRDEWRQDEKGGATPVAKAFVLECQIGLLLALIARLSDVAEGSLDTNNEELQIYNRFVLAVEQHYREHWTMPQYLGQIGVSERRLHSICHRISHTTPKQLIRERLLTEARRLLAFTRKTSNEIAYELGFSDPSYFSRFFRRAMGETPLHYREQVHASSAVNGAD